MKMATCKLCNQDKVLINKSHIIPEFLYHNLYNDKHLLIRGNALDLVNKSRKVSKLPQGEYEGGLLCKECDNKIIGQYETYLGSLFNNPYLAIPQRPIYHDFVGDDGLEFTRIENIDYKLLKLCLLSIIWRASISKRPIFEYVKLGKYEDKIREQIYSGTPSIDTEIPIVIFSWTNDKETPTQIIAQPTKHKNNGKTFYSFVINGYIILYGITPGAINKAFESVKLQSNNTITIVHFPKGEGMDFIFKYMGLAVCPPAGADL